MRKDERLSPMYTLYKEFEKILKKITIKFGYLAEKYETVETKAKADEYLDAIQHYDNFFTYQDYTLEDLQNVGITDYESQVKILSDFTKTPVEKRDALLAIRRQRVIDLFEEQNNYYRMLNGFPPIEVKSNDLQHIFYVSDEISEKYGIAKNIPIHLIQDYYNNIESGDGDSKINALEGIGYIDQIRELNPNDTYLKYIGSKRISLLDARRAKNFEILQLERKNIRANVYDAFIMIYSQCRDYVASTIYEWRFRSFMSYYDNFIGMCIMVMAINQLIVKQIPYSIKRDFFDVYALKMLYEAYNIPYDLKIDSETQKVIAQNLNLLINNKATNKVIYDVANLLGFHDLKAYKYYLAKEHKFDAFGAPIFRTTKRFNNDTGEYETVPDYAAMYDIYFQKEELMEDDFIQSFNSQVNRVEYDRITQNDPYWWEDQNLIDRKYETEYNFVESKYLSLGISYKMTDIIFENIILLKLLLSPESNSNLDIMLSVPKVIEGIKEPLFDIIILLLCLVSKKHKLTGEIITVPTDIIHVMDYMKNNGETYNPTHEKFDYFNPDHMVDTFAFDFNYFKSDDGKEQVKYVKKLLEERDKKDFLLGKDTLNKDGSSKSIEEIESYISVLTSMETAVTQEEKIAALNSIYSAIKGLYQFLNFKMTDACDRETYDALRTMYRAAFYSQEMANIFTITTNYNGKTYTRVAKNFFEFLYYKNPTLYSAIFHLDYKESYSEYISSTGSTISYESYMEKVLNHEIDVKYDLLKDEVDDTDDNEVTYELLYYYINHIITRLKEVINNINFLYMINDTSTPLEDLLLKIIRFVKSYTVDMLGLDIIYICDFKTENMIRLIDEIDYINKTIQLPETTLLMPFKDQIKLESLVKMREENKLRDRYVLKSKIKVDKYNREDYSQVSLHDAVIINGVMSKDVENKTNNP